MMKLVLNEIKVTKGILILFTCILVLIIPISLVFSTVAFNCLQATDDIVKEETLQNELAFDISNAGSKTIAFLDTLDCESVSYTFDFKKKFDREVSCFVGDTAINDVLAIVNLNDKISKELKDERLLKGYSFFNFDNSADDYISVWINKKTSIKYGIDIADVINIKNDEKNLSLQVKGIYSDVSGIPSMFVSFDSANSIFKHFGVSIKKSVTITEKTYTDARRLSSELKKQGINYSSTVFEMVDDYFQYYYMFFSVLLTLSFMIMSISLIMFFTYSRLIQFKRKYYINMLLVLGMSRIRIAVIYFIILEILIIVTSIVSTGVIGIFYGYISEMVSGIFELEIYNFSFAYETIIYTIFVMSFFVFLGILNLYIKLKKINEIETLRGN
ncbi:MAG: hypothetical protein J6A58_13600 [Oscillospiraceae bacterium]|nr:hypothetical protein [Oscillospiraceae bacterium]